MSIEYYRQYEPLFGQWKIIEEIGSGSFGEVYRIERQDFNHTYTAALKTISIPQSKSELEKVRDELPDEESVTTYFRSMVEDFVGEIAMMSGLKGHSNIVSYEDHQIIQHKDDIGWDILIRMELLTPFPKYAKSKALTYADVIRLGIDICKALELCQKKNIYHRDIKPSNIFVNNNGDFKLGDFGVARIGSRTGSKSGTEEYMAPEVYFGRHFDQTIDTYSLGLVMYRLLNNGNLPFITVNRHSEAEKALKRRVNGEPLPAPANTYGELAKIILKACAYDPKDRFETPTQFRAALESLPIDNSIIPRQKTDVPVGNGGGLSDPWLPPKYYCRKCGREVKRKNTLCDKCKAKKWERFLKIAFFVVLSIVVVCIAGLGLIRIKNPGTTEEITAPLQSSTPAPTTTSAAENIGQNLNTHEPNEIWREVYLPVKETWYNGSIQIASCKTTEYDDKGRESAVYSEQYSSGELFETEKILTTYNEDGTVAKNEFWVNWISSDKTDAWYSTREELSDGVWKTSSIDENGNETGYIISERINENEQKLTQYLNGELYLTTHTRTEETTNGSIEYSESYDANGKQNGKQISTYDKKHNLLSKEYESFSDGSYTNNEYYEYDSENRVVKATRIISDDYSGIKTTKIQTGKFEYKLINKRFYEIVPTIEEATYTNAPTLTPTLTPKPTPTPTSTPAPTPKNNSDLLNSGECGENACWEFYADGTLYIFGSGKMADFSWEYTNYPTYITSQPWNVYCDKIKALVIQDGITGIGNYAFRECKSLASIAIPNSVTSIGEDAFFYCESLTDLTIPDSVASISGRAFLGCVNLTSVTIPDSVTSIADSTFSGCESLTSVTIPDSVTSIGGSAFSGCKSLTSVTLPDSVTSIGRHAFSECKSLTSVAIPDSVTTIGEGAFYCSGLTSVTIPGNVIRIEDSTFMYCKSLASVTIPDSVTSIGYSAFEGCKSLTSVTIPDSVAIIDSWAFKGCNGLKSIMLPNSITYIGIDAFSACYHLADIHYSGSKAQWGKIDSFIEWWGIYIQTTVHCTDGDIKFNR